MNLPLKANEDPATALAASTQGERTAATPEQPGRSVKICRSRRKWRRGAAVVEFAVVSPVFMLMVFGMIEYGRMVMAQANSLVNASREGARVGVLDDSTATDVSTAVSNYLAGANISGATVTCNPADPSTAGYGASVAVTVSVPFSKVSWVSKPMFLGGTTMTAKSIMRRETTQ